MSGCVGLFIDLDKVLLLSYMTTLNVVIVSDYILYFRNLNIHLIKLPNFVNKGYSWLNSVRVEYGCFGAAGNIELNICHAT